MGVMGTVPMLRGLCAASILSLVLAGCGNDVAGPDATSLAAVLDLRVTEISNTHVTLNWTSPANNGGGTAHEYDLRYSTAVFGLAAWDSVSRADSLPAPEPPGTTQSVDISHLAPGTTYYFALRTSDRSGNWSELSNLAPTTTYIEAPPEFVLLWGEAGSGEGQFNSPQGIAIDGFGNVYVADQGNHRIQKFDENGSFLAAWGGLGQSQGQFNTPTDLVATTGGELLVADTNNDRVQRFTEDGTYIGEWSIAFPQQIDLTAGGVLVLASSTIYRFDPSGQLMDSWSVRKYGAWTRDLACVTEGQYFAIFEGFSECCTDITSGYFFYQGPYVHLLARTTIIDAWGTTGVGSTNVTPSGVAVDGGGHVYVADRRLDRIQRRNYDGLLLTEWGTPGSAPGQFAYPRMLACTADYVYVVDSGNNRIQKFRAVSP